LLPAGPSGAPGGDTVDDRLLACPPTPRREGNGVRGRLEDEQGEQRDPCYVAECDPSLRAHPRPVVSASSRSLRTLHALIHAALAERLNAVHR
jgi:hypothetical protein